MFRMFNTCLMVCISCCFILVAGSDGTTDSVKSDLRKLKEILLKDYDKTISPIVYSHASHTSGIFLNLLRIRDLDEAKGELTVEGPIGFNWEDSRLRWNGSYTFLQFSPEDVWTPSLNILNSLQAEEKTLDAKVLVFRRGIWWAPRYVLHTACTPNLRFYPFDKQECAIEITAITQEGEVIATNYTSADARSYGYLGTRNLTENIRWKFLSAENRQETRTLNIGISATVEVFTVTIQRTMPLIALCLLTPGIICVILLLSTFWITPGSNIRVGINVTSLLVCSSSLFSIGKILPATGNTTPIIVEYAATALILTTLSSVQAMAVSVLVRLDKPPPVSYFKFLFAFPPWLLRILGLSPSSSAESSIDQTFLFSELAENNAAEEDNDVSNTTLKSQDEIAIPQNAWKKIIILFERLSFYVYVLVIGLFVLSVMINE